VCDAQLLRALVGDVGPGGRQSHLRAIVWSGGLLWAVVCETATLEWSLSVAEAALAASAAPARDGLPRRASLVQAPDRRRVRSRRTSSAAPAFPAMPASPRRTRPVYHRLALCRLDHRSPATIAGSRSSGGSHSPSIAWRYREV
jgi:hypothetical protein